MPLLLGALLLTLGCAHPPRSTAGGPAAPADVSALWVDPGDVQARDLFAGAGGAALTPAPGTRFRFIRKDTTGYSRGWDVVDPSGVEWSVKYGPEAQSEIVASRILWALGYHQLPTYYVEQWVLEGGDTPGPGTPARFRPRLPGHRKAGTWSWYENPFADTEAFRGLLVLMRVLNNWDLLERNTAVIDLDQPAEGARRWYVVLDLGASLGKTRLVPDPGTRNDIEDFEEQGFIKGVDRDGVVRFDDLGRRDRALFKVVTIRDVRWTCERLKRLTDAQWRDAFRAARYEPAVAERFIVKIQDKVRAGLALSAPEAASS